MEVGVLAVSQLQRIQFHHFVSSSLFVFSFSRIMVSNLCRNSSSLIDSCSLPASLIWSSILEHFLCILVSYGCNLRSFPHRTLIGSPLTLKLSQAVTTFSWNLYAQSDSLEIWKWNFVFRTGQSSLIKIGQFSEIWDLSTSTVQWSNFRYHLRTHDQFSNM